MNFDLRYLTDPLASKFVCNPASIFLAISLSVLSKHGQNSALHLMIHDYYLDIPIDDHQFKDIYSLIVQSRLLKSIMLFF